MTGTIIQFKKNSKALSISCGEGIWDYIVFKNCKFITDIVATDIVSCPVSLKDSDILNSLGKWRFNKVREDGLLPFKDNSFDFIFHQDTIEHTEVPFKFLSEQFRVLKNNGIILFGTPNLFRPCNIGKLLIGRLKFPVKIGFIQEIGDYIHIQEFCDQHLKVMLQEIGFSNIKITHCFFGLPFLSFFYSMFPKSKIGKLLCHYLTFTAHVKKVI